MTRDQIEAIFQRRLVAQEALDVEAFTADYADDCIVDSPTGGTHQGRDAIKKVIQAWFNGFPDLKVLSHELVIDGNSVVQVWNIEGTDLGGFMGLPATGKSFRLPVVFLCTLRDRQIVRERRIYDFTGLLVQVGLLKAKPA